MKKIILIILCLFVALTVVACGNNTNEVTESATKANIEKITEEKVAEEKTSNVEAEIPTEVPSEKPTEQPTEEPTEPKNDEPTEPSTEKSTEKPTEKPTETPTEESTVPKAEEPVVRPTDGPEISAPEYEKLRKTTYYSSVEDLFVGLRDYNTSDLKKISETENMYLFDTVSKHYIADTEIKNGIFGNFRNQLLNDDSIMLPYINGELVSSDPKGNQSITLHSAGDYRSPTIIFQTQFSVAVSTKYLDTDIVDEANRKGAAWTKSKLDPYGINIDNYREHFDNYYLQGYTFYKDAQAYEKNYSLSDRKVTAFVLDYPISTTNNYVNVFIVYDDLFVCVYGQKAAVEEILPTLSFYECEFSTGKPLRDTPGRSEDYLAVK